MRRTSDGIYPRRFFLALLCVAVLSFAAPARADLTVAQQRQLQEQARARWAELNAEQRAALIQWVVNPGDMQRFLAGNTDDLREFLLTGREDANFNGLRDSLRDAIRRLEESPSLTVFQERRLAELYRQQQTLRNIQALRQAAFFLTIDSTVSLWRGTNAQNALQPVAGVAGALRAPVFLAAASQRSYAATFSETLINIEIPANAPVLVALPPDFASNFIGPSGTQRDRMETFYRLHFRSRLPSIRGSRVPTFEEFMASPLWRTYQGTFLYEYTLRHQESSIRNPAFRHRGRHTESEFVFMPFTNLTLVEAAATAEDASRYTVHSSQPFPLDCVSVNGTIR